MSSTVAEGPAAKLDPEKAARPRNTITVIVFLFIILFSVD
jgi:hypothetical protein